MGRPSDREFELKRQINELEEKVASLEVQNQKLRRSSGGSEGSGISRGSDNGGKGGKSSSGSRRNNGREDKKSQSTFKVGQRKLGDCPQCGGDMIKTELPHGIMVFCKEKCGYRGVQKNDD